MALKMIVRKFFNEPPFLVKALVNYVLPSVIVVFLTLDVVTNQCACPQANSTADGCAGSGMTFGVADNPANCGTTESADACAFLSCCQWSAGATASGNRSQTDGNDPGREVVPLLVVVHVFSFRIF
jgi:hypothetical protein